MEKVTADEFIRTSQQENDPNRHELLHGKIITSPLFSYMQSHVVTQLFARLRYHGDVHDFGYTYDSGQGYQLDKNTILHPTLSFVAKDHLTDSGPSPIHGSPSIAIEVVSAMDKPEYVNEKVRTYLDHGTEEVWIVYAHDGSADIYTQQDGEQHLEELGMGDKLISSDLLPDFDLPLYTLFPAKNL